MAYGLIAVSPLGSDWAVFGITAGVGTTILFGLLTGLFGSNRFLVSGPRAVTALVIASGIAEALDRGYSPQQAILVAFSGVVVAGLFQILAGYLRMGRLVSYVPLPVLAGFVCASAFLVSITSIPMVFGAPELGLLELLRQPGRMDAWALVVSGICIVATLVLQRNLRWMPPALGGLGLAALAYYAGTTLLGMAEAPTVGDMNLGALLREPLLLQADFLDSLVGVLDIVFLSGLSTGLLASFDTVLSGSAISLQTGTSIDSDRDLKLHGSCNVFMGICGLLPGSGALSRSATIINAGARTRAANAGSALVFLAMLLFLQPVVASLPLWATAGMLLVTSLQAFDKLTMQKFWGVITRRIKHPAVVLPDLAVTSAVVIAAVLFDLIVAVGLGLVLAVLLFVLSMGKSAVRRVYRCGKVRSKVNRPLDQLEHLEAHGDAIVVVELQGPLFFGACSQLKTQLQALLGSQVRFVVLDMRHLTSIDSTGISLLVELQRRCAAEQRTLLISHVEKERRSQVHDRRDTGERRQHTAPLRQTWLRLQANGALERLGEGAFCRDTDEAISRCEESLLAEAGLAAARHARTLLTSSPLFKRLSVEQVVVLGRYVQLHRFRPGQVVFREGDAVDSAYLIVRGRLDAEIAIQGTGRCRLVGTFTTGSLFGEMGLIDNEPRSATISAKQPALCLGISRVSFDQLQCEEPAITLILLGNLSSQFAARMRHANNMIAELER